MTLSGAIETPEVIERSPEPFEIQVTTREDIRSKRGEYPFDIEDLVSTAEEIEYDPHTDFIISGIDDRNKFTGGLANCTSLVAVGSERDTGRNISFQTHQSDPTADSEFYTQLALALDQIKVRSLPGTVSVVVAGGSAAHSVREKAYEQTKALITETVIGELGIGPQIAAGPKTDTKNNELVYVDTQSRRIFVIR